MTVCHILEDYCTSAGLQLSPISDGAAHVLEFDHEAEVTLLPDRDRLMMVTRLCPLIELSDEKLIALLEAKDTAFSKTKDPIWTCLAADIGHVHLVLKGQCERLQTRDDLAEAIEALLEKRRYWLGRIQDNPQTQTGESDSVELCGLPDYTLFV